MRPVTRRERRAERQRRYATTREVRLAAGLEHRVSGREGKTRAIGYEAPLPEWLQPLDYRGSGESGALVVHTHSLSWHRAKSPNITVPPAGKEWGRSALARVVRVDKASATEQDIDHRRGKQIADIAAKETTE